jgi:hypothetical protein
LRAIAGRNGGRVTLAQEFRSNAGAVDKKNIAFTSQGQLPARNSRPFGGRASRLPAHGRIDELDAKPF